LAEEFIRSRTLALEPYQKLSKQEFIQKIKTKAFRDEIRKIYDDYKLKLSVIHTKADPFWMDRFIIVACKNKEYEEKTIAKIAQMKNTDPLEAIFDLMVEDPDTKWFQFFDEKEVMHQTIPVFINHPMGAPSTDMGALPPLERPDGFEIGGVFETPSAVAYGGFADYIGTYVRERKCILLEEAVRKATSFPAQRFGLEDRGQLRPDAYADILIFDLDKIKMTGNYMKPAQRPDGIEFVLVNGKLVYKDKTHSGAKPGKVLRRGHDLKKRM
jgi:N-acyl-D-amino-acid deacylase